MKQLKAFQRFGFFTGILALTILSCSGLSDVSSIFATDTPTPTSTFTPSPTLTPSPTSTPTLTPSPSPTSVPGESKAEEQADGSTLFTDYDNSYQLTFPQGWIILPFSSGDIADNNPEFKQMAENFENLDPDVIRTMALNRTPNTCRRAPLRA